ncbi:hypothetical protein SASPL_105806 [Salvia splendens]|uniref:Uncharacterized protein n=1 Tax=Salvia splendens TaxID=180675 RepID=A0A8X8YMF2_SALSN|nr:hypothetical protein SASPL_105806 [Salvia splendens]
MSKLRWRGISHVNKLIGLVQRQEKINARWDEMLKAVTSIKDRLQGSSGATAMVDVESNLESLVEEDDLIVQLRNMKKVDKDSELDGLMQSEGEKKKMGEALRHFGNRSSECTMILRVWQASVLDGEVKMKHMVVFDSSGAFKGGGMTRVVYRQVQHGEVIGRNLGKQIDLDVESAAIRQLKIFQYRDENLNKIIEHFYVHFGQRLGRFFRNGVYGQFGSPQVRDMLNCFGVGRLLTVTGGLITDEGAGAFSFVNDWKEQGLFLDNNKQWLHGSCKECHVTVAAKVNEIVVAVVVRVGMASVVEKETRMVIVAATDEKTAGNGTIQWLYWVHLSASMAVEGEPIMHVNDAFAIYEEELGNSRNLFLYFGADARAGKRLDNAKKFMETECLANASQNAQLRKLATILSVIRNLKREADMLGASRIKVVCQGAHAWGLEQGLRVNASKALPSSTKETMTVCDVLNSTLDEEIAPDSKVLVKGEEVSEYHDAYKLTKGLFDKFGPEERGCWIQPSLRLDFWNTSCRNIYITVQGL